MLTKQGVHDANKWLVLHVNKSLVPSGPEGPSLPAPLYQTQKALLYQIQKALLYQTQKALLYQDQKALFYQAQNAHSYPPIYCDPRPCGMWPLALILARRNARSD